MRNTTPRESDEYFANITADAKRHSEVTLRQLTSEEKRAFQTSEMEGT